MITISKTDGSVGRLEFDSIHFCGLRKNDGSISISPARYARGKTIVRTTSDGLFMGRAARLASTISRRRYTNRERGYVMSPSQANKLQRLFLEGWDACAFTDTLEPPASASNGAEGEK